MLGVDQLRNCQELICYTKTSEATSDGCSDRARECQLREDDKEIINTPGANVHSSDAAEGSDDQ